MSNLENANGRVIFSKIDQLPDQWWNDPAEVWTVWDKNTYYLWGANASNYDLKQGDSLSGGGMAGSNGPTRGYAHDHYIGLDTMQFSETRNPAVFRKLATLQAAGHDIVVPIYKGCFSLGTGIASGMPDWEKIQEQMFEGILSLILSAPELAIPADTFWPDCRTLATYKNVKDDEVSESICSTGYRHLLSDTTEGVVVIKSVTDIKTIIAQLH